jgi:hypothetical protein
VVLVKIPIECGEDYKITCSRGFFFFKTVEEMLDRGPTVSELLMREFWYNAILAFAK